MRTTLMFALAVKFGLKMEGNAWGIQFSGRFLCVLQQNIAYSRLLYLLNKAAPRFLFLALEMC